MGLKDDWKDTGKNLGKSFVGLGKSIIKSVEVGADKVLDEEKKDENGEPVPTGLRDSWSKVGHSFGEAGKSLGKAVAGTAKSVAESLDDEKDAANEEPKQEREEDKKEDVGE
ncbi:MAG: hypothetical protein J5585_05665 [Clostridia bacterium]|jgi:hypothetical protein|nr:hypothetical protein [Clostridia bacterium]